MRELTAYSPLLAAKPACFVLSKSDLLMKDDRAAVPKGWLSMSAVTGDNVGKVISTLTKMIDKASQGNETVP
jgi:GTPase involved in cell partitioning and DNA repair